MKQRSVSFFLLITVSLMFFFLTFSIAAPIVCRPFYYAHVEALHLADMMPWSVEQIHDAYNEMLDFCVYGTPFGTGVLQWSESGRAHFADCAVLFRIDFIVLLLSAAVLLVCVLLYRRGLRPVRPCGRGPSFWAGSITAAVFCVLTLFAASDFQRAFILFHRIFFPGKENWLFDPAADQIILILPQVFFRNCAILIVALLLSFCAFSILWDLVQRRKKMNNRKNSSLQECFFLLY